MIPSPRKRTTQGAYAPIFDPDFLIIERDPEKLHAYARGLLHCLRNPSRSYSFEKVKAATVWLVGAYVGARVPLASEMHALIAGVVKWNRQASALRKVQKKNEPAYWAAIRFEAAHPRDPNGKAPSAATLYVEMNRRVFPGAPVDPRRRSCGTELGLVTTCALDRFTLCGAKACASNVHVVSDTMRHVGASPLGSAVVVIEPTILKTDIGDEKTVVGFHVGDRAACNKIVIKDLQYAVSK